MAGVHLVQGGWRVRPRPVLLLLLLSLVGGACATPCTDASGEDGLNWSGADLKGNPHSMESPEPSECAALCNATAACDHWTFHKANGCSGHGEHWDCAKKGAFGCCFLKSGQGHPAGNPCTCSGRKGAGPLPPSPPPAPPPGGGGEAALGECPLVSPPQLPPKGARNVMYRLRCIIPTIRPLDWLRIACVVLACRCGHHAPPRPRSAPLNHV
jgi:hypothetical protein